MKRFENPDVAGVFDAYPADLKSRLLRLRQLIFETAAEMDRVGPLEETLKWGQPSYLTATSKSGTTIRIDQIGSETGQYGLFVHCQTTLIPTFRDFYPEELSYDGKRAILFDVNEDPPVEPLRHCIALALTYHLDKKRGGSAA